MRSTTYTSDDSNVLAVDYRGFADSTGDPSQEGLAIDARTAWDWIAARVEKAGAGPADKQIVIAGHSLGTGVSSALAAQLADEGGLTVYALTIRSAPARGRAYCAIYLTTRYALFVSMTSDTLTKGTGSLASFHS